MPRPELKCPTWSSDVACRAQTLSKPGWATFNMRPWPERFTHDQQTPPQSQAPHPEPKCCMWDTNVACGPHPSTTLPGAQVPRSEPKSCVWSTPQHVSEPMPARGLNASPTTSRPHPDPKRPTPSPNVARGTQTLHVDYVPPKTLPYVYPTHLTLRAGHRHRMWGPPQHSK
ncbi:hypothetical protein BU15DRAFT_64359 [Melanogaster broomeanus]|nr:hypothetical protein BU15DRAFT_64359 [Melanogaster broomeanus]